MPNPLTERETNYIRVYGEFWTVPYDWHEDRRDDVTSSFHAVREWLAGLQMLTTTTLRAACTDLKEHGEKRPALDDIRRAYWRICEQRRLAGQQNHPTLKHACSNCEDSGLVTVAWANAPGGIERRPQSRVVWLGHPIPCPATLVYSRAVPCKCNAGHTVNGRKDRDGNTLYGYPWATLDRLAEMTHRDGAEFIEIQQQCAALWETDAPVPPTPPRQRQTMPQMAGPAHEDPWEDIGNRPEPATQEDLF